MKKLLTLLLTMTLMFVLAACGQTSNKGDGEDTKTKVEKEDVYEEKGEEKKKDETEVEGQEQASDANDVVAEDKKEEPSKPDETAKPSKPAKPSGTTLSEHKHSYASKITKAATCGAEGIKTFTCTCGATYTEKIAKTGSHSWGEWKTVKEPSVSAKGTSQRKCNHCTATENKDIAQIANHFYNASVDGRWTSDAISVAPKEVYFENGKLIAKCFVVNGYSTNATRVCILEMTILDRNGKEVAHAYFNPQNLSIAKLSYIEHTFKIDSDAITSTDVDLTALDVRVRFRATH